jgi:hypothetical protein
MIYISLSIFTFFQCSIIIPVCRYKSLQFSIEKHDWIEMAQVYYCWYSKKINGCNQQVKILFVIHIYLYTCWYDMSFSSFVFGTVFLETSLQAHSIYKRSSIWNQTWVWFGLLVPDFFDFYPFILYSLIFSEQCLCKPSQKNSLQKA